MHRRLLAAAILAGVTGAALSAQPPRRDVDNTAAFARLYGVVRYFHPGDASAGLAWNRFAVYGVKRVRAARDAAELQKTLVALFAPLGPGIEVAAALPAPPAPGIPDPSLIVWRYAGAGMEPQTQSPFNVYRGKRTNRDLELPRVLDGVVTMTQMVQAMPLRGKTIRLRGLVRVTAAGPESGAALWLRVDRSNQQAGFFDNMGSRPIRESAWREYTIEGPVADDATNVAFGAMATGTALAEFDGLAVSVKDASGTWAPVAIVDGGFEEALGAPGWNRAGTAKTAVVTQPSEQAPEGQRYLRIAAPPRPPIRIEAFEGAPLAVGAHADVDLGAGLKARIRLALTDAEARTDANTAAGVEALTKALDAAGEPPEEPDLDTRLADVVVAWNVYRHFYPYWTEAQVDWDARLRPQLEAAYAATTRDGQRKALRLLVADVRDGHGGVNDVRLRRRPMFLPLSLELREKRVVVTATGVPDQAPVGAIVTGIDGSAAERRLDDLMKLWSGSTQWRERRATQELAACQPGTPVTLALETSTGARSSSVACEQKPFPPEKRPEPIAELPDGVWYVDITRARMDQITPVLPKLAEASGVVFDVRGYPTDAGFGILGHLLNEPEQDRWMHVAYWSGPFGTIAGWNRVGWDKVPQAPRLKGKLVFLTDGRAISYAESVMGYIRDRRLGTIVGATTAGANGNVATFLTPSGFSISFTGMRVTKHDGSSAFHLAGVGPDIPVTPTIAGLRAGRDEVLERGIQVVTSGR
jgi:hypothetical protein